MDKSFYKAVLKTVFFILEHLPVNVKYGFKKAVPARLTQSISGDISSKIMVFPCCPLIAPVSGLSQAVGAKNKCAV
jgi:hypothetical protein